MKHYLLDTQTVQIAYRNGKVDNEAKWHLAMRGEL